VVPDLTSALEGNDGSQSADLNTGKVLIALADKLARSKDEADQRQRHALSDALGIDLAPFVGELPYMDLSGIEDVHRSLGALDATQILSPWADGKITIGRNEWHDLMKSVANATTTHGWTSNMAESLGAFARAYVRALQKEGYAEGMSVRDRNNLGEMVTMDKRVLSAKVTFDRADVLAAYFEAYFRNGAIFEANFDSQGLENDLMSEIKKVVTDTTVLDQIQKEITDANSTFENKLCGQNVGANGTCTVVGDIGEQTFVTRAGKSYGFPGITATIDPTAAKKISTNKINSSEIKEDLVRVLVEGAGDAAFDVPGVANSTLCTVLKRCATDPQSQGIQQVNNVGDETEAATNEVVSELVRGTWLFSLNNEALANSITTFVAVGARKAAEAAAWRIENKDKCEETNAPVASYRSIHIHMVP
jgi:hypothetical protein